MAFLPEIHYGDAQACLDEIVKRKDDKEFTAEAATTLLYASIAHSVQGILAAKINDPA